MALKHDSQGFLIGDPIDLRKATDYLRGIRTDIADIKRAMSLMNSGVKTKAPNIHQQVVNKIAVPRVRSWNPDLHQRDASGQFVSAKVAPASRLDVEIMQLPAVDPAKNGSAGAILPVRNSLGIFDASQQPTVEPARRRNPGSQLPERDASGKFVPKSSIKHGDLQSTPTVNSAFDILRKTAKAIDPKPRKKTEPERESKHEESLLKNIADSVGNGAANVAGKTSAVAVDAVSGFHDVDPTIKAFHEVAEPLKRGYDIFTGGSGESKETRWLHKLFDKSVAFFKQQRTFNKAQKKIEEQIESNTENAGGSGGGGSSFLGGAISSLLGKFLPWIAGGIGALGAGGAMEAMGKIRKMGLNGLGKLGKGAKGLFKRIPLLGALLGSLGAASDVYGAETDDKLSRRQKNQAEGKAVGGAGGTIGGMMGGAALGSFFGPVGAVVGGILGSFLGDQAGQIIGEKVVGWIDDLSKADIPGKIISAWESVTGIIKTGWEKLEKGWGEFVEKAKAGWDAFTGLFNTAYTALKALPVIGPAVQAAEDAAKKLAESAKELAAKAIETGKQAVEATVDAAKKGVEWAEKNTTVGKAAYAAAKAIGKSRVFEMLTGESETREGGTRSWRNNNPGNLEYNENTKKMGAIGTDGRFAIFPDYETGRNAKEGLIFGGKNYRNLNLTEAIERYAPPSENNTAAYQKAVLDAVGNLNKKMSEYSPAERSAILDAMQKVEGYKPGVITANSLYKEFNRFASDKPVVTASFQAPAVPKMPAPPPIAEAPQIVMPLGSDAKQPPINVVMPQMDVGQDVSDRGIAHIATGGICMAPR